MNTSKGIKGAFAEVRRSSGQLCLEWRIPYFLELSGRGGDCYDSPTFFFCGGSWYIRVWTHWIGFVLLELRSEDSATKDKTVSVAIGLRGSEVRRLGEWEFGSGSSWCVKAFCLRSEFIEQKERLMPDGALTITCEMKMPVTATDSATQTDCSLEAEVITEVKESSEKQGIETLAKDFAKLLTNSEDSDVTVQVGDTVFTVHRVILSARCPVLAAMFRHQTAERATKKILIEDCEPDIFGEYLHYVYSGSVRRLTDQNVFGLYGVADKYLADDLKLQCLEHIMKNLSIRTFCDTVRLALTHGEAELLKLATEFATENIRSIISTAEWLSFIRECPTAANEIFKEFLGARCSCQKSKQ